MKQFLFVCFFFCNILFGWGQQADKQVTTQGQSWIAYMSTQRLSKHFSLWNDAHLVPQGFFVMRTGLTYHFPEKVSITGGYAYLGLPAGVTKDLKRPEHRPWGQLVVSTPLGTNWNFLFRLRYDARFRQNLLSGKLADGFSFNHRIRFMATFRKDFPGLTLGGQVVPFLSMGNEVHINAGKNVLNNYMDQNRVTGTVGLRRKGIQLQAGYMNRTVQLPSGNQLIVNHTLLLWVSHAMDFRRQ
jgi:hypothetical protein